MEQSHSMKDIQGLYGKGTNIMRLFRDLEGSSVNSLRAILLSYDLQAGTAIDGLLDPIHQEFQTNFTTAVAKIFDTMNCRSVLEAGVGDVTALTHVVKKMAHTPEDIYGFDLSWSRLACGKHYAKQHSIDAQLFIGNMLEIPILDHSFDVVYTSGAIEPNRGREREILSELHRITNHCLVIIEPSNELGNEETKKHIEEHSYCRDLFKHATDLGFHVIEHRLFDYSYRDNQTALMIIEKQPEKRSESPVFYACPCCRNPLLFQRGNFYCDSCFLIFPVVDDIPCLMSSQGILGSRYLAYPEASK